jgi:hypothetical protein
VRRRREFDTLEALAQNRRVEHEREQAASEAGEAAWRGPRDAAAGLQSVQQAVGNVGVRRLLASSGGSLLLARLASGRGLTRSSRLRSGESRLCRQLLPDEAPAPIERDFEVMPFIPRMEGHAVRELDALPDRTAFFQACTNAYQTWPFIQQTEADHGLPADTLMAVGWRETGLRNIVGDFGHGHGVWQLDDRANHMTPDEWAAFDADVEAQATRAAAKLARDFAAQKRGHPGLSDEALWVRTFNIYNSGRPDAAHTTGHNYGPDVMNHLLHRNPDLRPQVSQDASPE